jgi:hypothetical protein
MLFARVTGWHAPVIPFRTHVGVAPGGNTLLHPQVSGPASASVLRLERLQRQHEADSQAVEAIWREMERSKVRRGAAAAGCGWLSCLR